MWIQRFSVLLAIVSAPAIAHHSVAANYDPSTTVMVEGEITEIAWQNPHIAFTLTATDGAEWELATHSLSIMRRMDAAESFVEIGQPVSWDEPFVVIEAREDFGSRQDACGSTRVAESYSMPSAATGGRS